VASLIALGRSDYPTFVAWLKHRSQRLLVVLLLIALFSHLALGLRVVIEESCALRREIPALLAAASPGRCSWSRSAVCCSSSRCGGRISSASPTSATIAAFACGGPERAHILPRFSRAPPKGEVAHRQCQGKRQCTREHEHEVTRHPQPFQRAGKGRGCVLQTACVPVAVLDHVPDLHETGRKEAEHTTIMARPMFKPQKATRTRRESGQASSATISRRTDTINPAPNIPKTPIIAACP
jgi:hypothetical protein